MLPLQTHVPNALTDSSTFQTFLTPRTRVSSNEQCNIFVNVASFRDTECKRTLIDLFLKAEHPENIFVGML